MMDFDGDSPLAISSGFRLNIIITIGSEIIHTSTEGRNVKLIKQAFKVESLLGRSSINHYGW
jgi:hypothetical protein